MVFRYAYLWAREHDQGKFEARKDRPSLAIAVAISKKRGFTNVLAVAVTHVPPTNPKDAVELSQAVKLSLGLDRERSWIVTTEANSFRWPGPDLRPVPDRKPETVVYGTIQAKLLATVARLYLKNLHRQRARTVPR